MGELYRVLENNPRIGDVALTDPRLWDNEYENEEWRTTTYERGKVVSLLLDVLIRERTDNAKALDDVMRALFQRYAHRAYDHSQWIETVKTATGVDVVSFSAEYVEGTRAPSKEEVESAFAAAKRLGVFARSATGP